METIGKLPDDAADLRSIHDFIAHDLCFWLYRLETPATNIASREALTSVPPDDALIGVTIQYQEPIALKPLSPGRRRKRVYCWLRD
ncbi:MAG: hypothetical protein ACRED0_10770 [Gammaproteobacteria bacterium]